MEPTPRLRRDTDGDDSAITEIVTPGAGSTPKPRAGPSASMPRTIGSYRIEAEIGRGGMGVVYRATDARLGRLVAIKTVQHQGGLDSEGAQRFLREARGLARLGKHPHVVQIHEVGEVDDRHYFVMDLVEGPSLDDVLEQGPLPIERAAAIAEKLARALDHAHRLGLIHRDVKPSNVLLAADGEPQLTDFGLAKDVLSQDDLSKSGDILGTPSYMAPEQAEAEGKVDGRADVYGMGALLYHMVTGRPPFRGSTWMETVALVLAGNLTPPRALRPEVGRDLQAVIEKALERNRDRRYASAAELGDDLVRLIEREPVLARPRSTLRRLGAWARRRPVRAGVGGALATFAVVGLALAPWALRRRAEERELREHKDWLAGFQARQAAAEAKLEAAEAKRVAARERAGRVDEALALLDEAIALDPRSWQAFWDRARVRLEIADAQDRDNERHNARYDTTAPRRRAIEDLDRALALNPRATGALLDRAEAHAALAEDEAAAADYARFAAEDAAASSAYEARARQRYRQGDLRGAVRLLDRAIAIDGERAGLYLLRGGIRPRLRDPRGGIADLARAIALEPDNAEAHYAHACTIQFYKEDFAGALAGLERAIALDGTNGNYYYARGNLRRLLDPATTGPIEDDYKKALELAPTLNGPATNLGVVLFQRGAHDEARAAFDRAIALDPTFGMNYYMRAMCWLSAEPPERAKGRADLDLACERAGGQPEPFHARADLREEDGDLAGAVADLESCLDRIPPDSKGRPGIEARIAELTARLRERVQ